MRQERHDGVQSNRFGTQAENDGGHVYERVHIRMAIRRDGDHELGDGDTDRTLGYGKQAVYTVLGHRSRTHERH